jgi:hypothetical protein
MPRPSRRPTSGFKPRGAATRSSRFFLFVAVALTLTAASCTSNSSRTATSTTTADTQLVGATVQRALLILADVAPTWDRDPDQTVALGPLCGQSYGITPLNQQASYFLTPLPPTTDDGQDEGTAHPFQAPRFLADFVAYFSEGDAEHYMADVRQAAASCAQWQAEGDTKIWRISNLSLPEVGDESAAFRVTFGEGANDLIYLRRGALVSLIVLQQFGDPDPNTADFEALARMADDKMRAANERATPASTP